MPQPADIQVNRIKQIACQKCKAIVDLRKVKPLSQMACPSCGNTFQVPCQIAQYLLVRRLAVGAAGAVYLAYDEVLCRQVALKVLVKSGQAGEGSYEEALREARVAATFNHPNIAQIYALSEDLGQPYLAMELLDGGSLESVVTEHGKLDEGYVLEVATGVLRALSEVHRLGMIHGDLKPQNILLTREGVPKLVDFGVARRVRGQAGGERFGSPYYMAPEVVLSKPADQRADLYSLGATLYHLLTGRPPFRGDDVEVVLTRRLKVRPKAVRTREPEVTAATSDLIDELLEPHPDRRPASADDTLDRVEQALRALDD
jgi:serine/threonine protein kinase